MEGTSYLLLRCADQARNMYCRECGEEVDPDSDYCISCGTPLDSTAATGTNVASETQPEAAGDQEDGGINITLSSIAGYLVGGLLLFLALGWAIAGSIVSSVAFLVGGAVALPIVRRQLKSQGVALSRMATVAIVVVAFASGAVFLDTSAVDGSQETVEQPASELALGLEDLPSGWTLTQNQSNATDVSRVFIHSDGRRLGTGVHKYDTIEDAESAYDQRLSTVQERRSTEPLDLAAESHLYNDNGPVVMYRFGNVVGTVVLRGAVVSDQAAINFAQDELDNYTK
jgi:hypothetical protein